MSTDRILLMDTSENTSKFNNRSNEPLQFGSNQHFTGLVYKNRFIM